MFCIDSSFKAFASLRFVLFGELGHRKEDAIVFLGPNLSSSHPGR